MDNVRFLGVLPREGPRRLYATLDLALVSLKKSERFTTVIPSKISGTVGGTAGPPWPNLSRQREARAPNGRGPRGAWCSCRRRTSTIFRPSCSGSPSNRARGGGPARRGARLRGPRSQAREPRAKVPRRPRTGGVRNRDRTAPRVPLVKLHPLQIATAGPPSAGRAGLGSVQRAVGAEGTRRCSCR